MENDILQLSYELADKKPISWLIRWLEEKQKEGNDYVQYTETTEWGDTYPSIKVSKV